MTAVKICGITEKAGMESACKAGADFIGFVFYPFSSRHIDPAAAAALAKDYPGVKKVGLFVDPDLDQLSRTLEALPLDMIQLHGHETPKHIDIVAERYGIPVMKAIRIGGQDDLENLHACEQAADWLLFDKKSDRAPGGTGEPFDWSLLENRTFSKPWMLAGGLNSGNIAAALSRLGPDAVDISSGVDDTPGVKSPEKIREFIETVRKTAPRPSE